MSEKTGSAFDWGQEGEESGFLDDFDAVIESAVFQDGQYGPQFALQLRPLDPAYTGNPVPAWYSVGRDSDYVIVDGGLRVEGPQFKNNSKVGLLAKEALRLGAKLQGNTADAWVGLAFHWKNVTMSSIAGREIKIQGKEPTMLAPTKYLGTHDVGAGDTGDAEIDDSSIGDLLIETLREYQAARGQGLKWAALALKASSKNVSARQGIISRGRTIMDGLVELGEITLNDDVYSIE